MTFLIILKWKFLEKTIPDINFNLRYIPNVLITNERRINPGSVSSLSRDVCPNSTGREPCTSSMSRFIGAARKTFMENMKLCLMFGSRRLSRNSQAVDFASL